MFSREFEDAAVGVLNECYRRDKVMSRQLLVRDLEIWGSTALMIADAAREMDFMGHSCCQTKLNEIWKGKMALYTSTWKVKSRFCVHSCVERGNSVVECQTSNRQSPCSNPLCYRFDVWGFLFSPQCLSSFSCINEYMPIDSEDNVSE